MRCLRCGQEFQPPDSKTNVCVNCADELGAEEDAQFDRAMAEGEAEARQKWETEEAERNARDRY